MKKKMELLTACFITLFLAAACWHSVQEIHYLKSFFPREFTVQEAMFASIVEFIKITLIATPLLIGWKLIRNALR